MKQVLPVSQKARREAALAYYAQGIVNWVNQHGNHISLVVTEVDDNGA